MIRLSWWKAACLLAALSVTVLAASALAAAPERARAGSPPPLDLSSLPSDEALLQTLWQRNPDLLEAQTRVRIAEAEVTRSTVLPNPGLEASWNAIPLGPTNPPGLSRLGDVPNYVIGLNQLFELGKRGPRQRAARSGVDAALHEAAELLRQRHLDLVDAIGRTAAAEDRVEALTGLVGDAARLTSLQQKRARHGDAAGLDAARSRLDEEKYASTLAEEQERLAELLLECGRLAGTGCLPFSGADNARAFLTSRALPSPDLAALQNELQSRPDLKALQSREESARAAAELARAHRIPDPTVSAGYVHDRFVESGNQLNSVFVGISLPLPVFDRGQADEQAATAEATAAARTRELLQARAGRELGQLATRLRAAAERRERLRAQVLPIAHDVVERLGAAVQAGGAPLHDLLLARQSLGALLLDAADLDLTVLHLTTALLRASSAGSDAASLPRNDSTGARR